MIVPGLNARLDRLRIVVWDGCQSLGLIIDPDVGVPHRHFDVGMAD